MTTDVERRPRRRSPVFGGDLRAIERIERFFSAEIGEMTKRERERHKQFIWMRYGYILASLVFLKICRRQLIRIEREANPPIRGRKPWRIVRLFRFATRRLHYLYLLPIATVTGSIFAMTHLNQILKEDEEENKQYFFESQQQEVSAQYE